MMYVDRFNTQYSMRVKNMDLCIKLIILSLPGKIKLRHNHNLIIVVYTASRGEPHKQVYPLRVGSRLSMLALVAWLAD